MRVGDQMQRLRAEKLRVAQTLAGVGFAQAQDTLKASQFGAQPQALQPEATLKEGLVKLA